MTKQPSYRFANYAESWEDKKLGEVGDFSIKTNSFSREKLNLNSGGIKNIHYGDILVKYNSTLDFENNSIPYVIDNDTKLTSDMFLKNGDIIFSDAAEDYSVGKCVELFNVSGNIVSGLHTIVCRPEIDFAQYFLGYYLNSNSYRQQVLPMVQGVKVSSISKGNLSKTNISFPSLPEQTAIGSFFQDIDQLISLQQRKLEVLKEQKKTYLKLLFPAKGQTKPALRFAGFEDEWKEVKLGEVGETYTGLSGKTKEDFGHGEGKFITYVNVFNNPLTDLYGLDSVEVDDKQRRVQYGDVLFTTSSETPEDVGLSSVWMGTEDNVYLNSFCFGYRPQKGIFDLYYLAFVLRSFSVRKEFMLLAQGISRFNISKTKVMDMSIHVPSLPEQEAIGSFFQDLDKAIAKQEEKVNQLKESKQTLLRKMFI